MREYRTSGSVRGAPGNRRSYRERFLMNRPAIPAELRRRVLIEAGHRCAIPTCRHIEVDIHHIIPWETCKTHDYDNLIALCPNCHRRAGKNEIDRKSLRLYKFNLRLLHDKFSNVEIDLLFQMRLLKSTEVANWPQFLLILLNRILDAGLIECRKGDVSGTVMGINLTPIQIRLTEKGREFINSVSTSDVT